MKLLLVLLALVVGQLCFADEAAVPPKAKNATGEGRHNYGRHHNRHRDYGHDDYDRDYRTPIVDDYVCDLEATILVVSSKHHVKEDKSYSNNNNYGGNNNYGSNGGSYGNSGGSYGNSGGGYGNSGGSYGNAGGYGGNDNYQSGGYGDNGNSYGGSSPSYSNNNYGNDYENKPRRREYATPEALRLKCSHIATYSEHDCHTCCQLSARHYHSVSKHEIFGFIINADEIRYDDKGNVRSKRSSGYGSQSPPPQNYGQSPAPSYGSAPAPGYGSEQNYNGNTGDYGSSPNYETQTPGYSSDSGYSSNSYAPAKYDSYGPPKNARCVCCAPKRHHHHDNYHRRRHYDRSESREY